jgi:hypothetical protein
MPKMTTKTARKTETANGAKTKSGPARGKASIKSTVAKVRSENEAKHAARMDACTRAAAKAESVVLTDSGPIDTKITKVPAGKRGLTSKGKARPAPVTAEKVRAAAKVHRAKVTARQTGMPAAERDRLVKALVKNISGAGATSASNMKITGMERGAHKRFIRRHLLAQGYTLSSKPNPKPDPNDRAGTARLWTITPPAS